MRIFFLTIFSFFAFQDKSHTNEIPNLSGIWVSTTKNLKVKVYYYNEKVFAKMVYFPCNHKVKLPMEKHFDKKNQNPKLRNRSYLDVDVLTELMFEKNNKWDGGQIYNPVTGTTYSASLKLISKNQIEVRGYMGFEFFGESIFFNRID
jgi:uncharacterized protein (DUF2147 family)